MKEKCTYHLLRMGQLKGMMPLVFMVCVCTPASFAQDVHLSQVYQSYMLFNPAATAGGDYDYRASLHYRKQWGAVDKGYGTKGLLGEASFFKGKGNTNFLGVGLQVFSDKSGGSLLKTTSVKGSAAYHIATDRFNRLSFGMALGYEHRSIDMSGLAWDEQYDGLSYDPAAPTGENVASYNRGYVDGSFGWWWWHSQEVDWKLGYAVHHFLQNRSFLDSPSDRLYMKQNLIFTLRHALPYIRMNYDAMISRQSGAMEAQIGFRTEYRLGMDSKYTNMNTSSAIFAGCHYRVGDAIIPTIGFEYEREFSAYLSYDLTFSSFNRVVGLGGGPEISLVYTNVGSGQRIKIK